MYSSPNHVQLREFMAEYGLTGADVAKAVGIDSRSVRRWTAPQDQAGARSMPWAAWMLLQLYVGAITVDEYRKDYRREERVERSNNVKFLEGPDVYEIKIDGSRFAVSYVNGRETGRFQLSQPEVDRVVSATSSAEAFAVLEE
jgi:hypothetical protein